MSSTASLAAFIVNTPSDAIPDAITHEAKRTLINLLGVARSASTDPSAAALEAASDVSAGSNANTEANSEATVIGRPRASLGQAALLNGYLAHLQDYDDTHFPSILHPSAPTWPSAMAAAERSGASGRELIDAFAIGAEVACRIAMSVHPWHYDAGWHITGTVGGFGAAAAASSLLGLTAEQTEQALGLAGTQAAGVREAFGTNGKALHAGHAAASGLRAALLASAGFTGPTAFLEGRRGFWAVLSPNGHNPTWIDALEAPLNTWALSNNGIKPYANGVVSHPLQDAVIELRNAHHLDPAAVTAIEARVHPLVLELMNLDPTVGLEGKFSHRHCAATALIDGAGHEAQFTDARVQDPQIAAIRTLVHATVDASLAEDEVHVTIRLADGTEHSTHVPHATGSPENPMSDTQLETKYRAIAGGAVSSDRTEALLRAAWKLDEAPIARDVISLAGS
jgi:2-methylcitrate dehydratase PrpD